MKRYTQAITKGAAAGVAGTVTMSALMLAAQRTGLMGKMPPEKITARALNAAGVRRSSATQDLLATVAHFGFGASAGAALAGVIEGTGVSLPPMVTGLLFGSLVWSTNYQGWIPAAGIMPRPGRDRPGRPQSMLAAHWVYGVTTALVLERLTT